MMIMISCTPLQIINGNNAADVGVVFVCVCGDVGRAGRCRFMDVCVCGCVCTMAKLPVMGRSNNSSKYNKQHQWQKFNEFKFYK